MPRFLRLALAALCASAPFLPTSAAAAVQSRTEGGVIEVTLGGTLSGADLTTLETLIATAAPGQPRALLLDAEIGDADLALRIGRLVREARFRTEVRPGARCVGACVLVLAAGTDRLTRGAVTLQRPVTDARAGEADTRAAEALNRARKYLGELDIPVDLAHALFTLPAGKARTLTEQELAFYRLSAPAALTFDEDDNATMARRMGLSMTQYLQFKELLLYKCDFFKDTPAQRQGCLDTAFRNFLPQQ